MKTGVNNVNNEPAKKLNETILFLKIDKGQNEKYLVTLEVKSELDKKPVIKTVVQNQTIGPGYRFKHPGCIEYPFRVDAKRYGKRTVYPDQ